MADEILVAPNDLEVSSFSSGSKSYVCRKVSLPDHPELLQFLPAGYSYCICEYEGEDSGVNYVRARIGGVADEKAAKQWLKILQRDTYVTWRVAKTHTPASIPQRGAWTWKTEYRCQHNVGANKSTKPVIGKGKHTACPASLSLTLMKDSVQMPTNKLGKVWDSHSDHLKLYCIMNNRHNHPIVHPDSMKRRDVSEETNQKLLTMFKSGLMPAKAYKQLKMDLVREYGADSPKLCDRAICPEQPYLYRLYYKYFPKRRTNKSKNNPEALPRLESPLSVPQESIDTVQLEGLMCVDDENEQTEELPVYSIDPEDEAKLQAELMQSTRLIDPNQTPQEALIDRLRNFTDTMCHELQARWSEFNESVTEFLDTYDRLDTDEKLVNALLVFGKPQQEPADQSVSVISMDNPPSEMKPNGITKSTVSAHPQTQLNVSLDGTPGSEGQSILLTIPSTSPSGKTQTRWKVTHTSDGTPICEAVEEIVEEIQYEKSSTPAKKSTGKKNNGGGDSIIIDVPESELKQEVVGETAENKQASIKKGATSDGNTAPGKRPRLHIIRSSIRSVVEQERVVIPDASVECEEVILDSAE